MHMQIQCPRLLPSAQKRKFCLGMITVRQTTKINMHKHAVYTQCTLTSVKITFGIRKCVWCLVSNHKHYAFVCTLYVIMVCGIIVKNLNSSAWERGLDRSFKYPISVDETCIHIHILCVHECSSNIDM